MGLTRNQGTWTPPPNWPQPEAGWSPPPGWVPDPTWGPAPPGWDFYPQTSAHQGAAGAAGAPWFKRKWVQVVAAGALGLAVGGGVAGAGAADSDKKADAAQERAVAAEAEVRTAQSAAESEVAAAEAKAKEAEERADKAGILAEERLSDEAAALEAAAKKRSDALAAREAAVKRREIAVGTAEKEIAANTFENGTYLVGDDIRPGTYKSEGGEGCYWSRDSKGGDIIDNDLGNGPSVMNVRSTDYSVTINCPSPFVLQR